MPREADVPYFNYRSGGDEGWRAGTACGPIGTKHPWTANGPNSEKPLRLGQQICMEICPVRIHCLAYSLAADIHHGTWGGMREGERRALSATERRRIIAMGRMTPYDEEQFLRTSREYRMVVVIAKTKFVPHLAPGEVGEVEDPLARAAVRNGYADLVGRVQNFDEWMYHGAELVVAGRTAQANDEAAAGRAKKPQTEMVAQPVVAMGESA